VADTTASAGDFKGAEAPKEKSRRDFIFIATGAVAAVGGAATVWPFIDQMNPSADTLALSTTEVDLNAIPEGQQITVLWQGKPVFVRHRTADEIQRARADDGAALKDRASDEERLVQANGQAGKPEWLVLQAACTHLGCIPSFATGVYGGWFCPCHGSVYDTAGRIRSGPAPLNLALAPYTYLNDTTIRIG